MERGRRVVVDVAEMATMCPPMTAEYPSLTHDEQAAWERAARSGDRFLGLDVRLAYLRRVIGADREQGEQAA